MATPTLTSLENLLAKVDDFKAKIKNNITTLKTLNVDKLTDEIGADLEAKAAAQRASDDALLKQRKENERNNWGSDYESDHSGDEAFVTSLQKPLKSSQHLGVKKNKKVERKVRDVLEESQVIVLDIQNESSALCSAFDETFNNKTSPATLIAELNSRINTLESEKEKATTLSSLNIIKVGQLEKQNSMLKVDVKAMKKQVEKEKLEKEMHVSSKTLVIEKEQLAKKLAMAKTEKSVLASLKVNDRLFQHGVTVRKSFFETCKVIWSDEAHRRVVVGSAQFDTATIDAKNCVVHRGDIVADRLLFKLGAFTKNEMSRKQREFEHIYGCKLTHPENEHPKLTETYNMHGTMVACYFETKFTHSEKMDKEFKDLFQFCVKCFEEKKAAGWSNGQIHHFAVTLRKYFDMRIIVDTTVKKERDRIHNR